MSLTRSVVGIMVVLAGAVIVTASAATPDRKQLRIVSAVMVDSDRDARADSVRLTYGVRIHHARDRDGRYPFAVAGYRIRSIGAASGKALVIALVESAQPDPEARPAIRYRRTRVQPVKGPTGAQAPAQLFSAVRAHGHAPTADPPPAPPPPPPPPAPLDSDGDGTLDAQDCGPKDAAVHPGAPDLPDLSFIDSNCDGIDGTEKEAIFVSQVGKDSNSGTKDAPKREITPAILAASLSGKDVYVAAGTYGRFEAKTGVGVYGGYDEGKWSLRSASRESTIAGSPEAVLVDDERGIVLQILTIHGANSGTSSYGIRAINGSALTLEGVSVVAGDGAAGLPGLDGARGVAGVLGGRGEDGHCDSNQTVQSRWGGSGGDGAPSPIGREGGDGGQGGDVQDYGGEAGDPGRTGQPGTPGGAGGSSGNPGKAGQNGQPGSSGSNGERGAGGTSTTDGASTTWAGAGGRPGTPGISGSGGGGGGGGGAQTGFFVLDGPGNGGGGGGSGGGAGAGGGAGRAGGGSFGIYLSNSTLVVISSKITAGAGGAGGQGGAGGEGGAPGGGGPGATKCASEVGAGGNGGRGGRGGDGAGGGGGAGGPSIGIFKAGTSSATLKETEVAVGAPGAGGAAGFGGLGSPAPAQAGIAQAVYP